LRKTLLLTAILAVCLTATGCFAPGFYGGLYVDVKEPRDAAAYYGATTTTGTKVGEASYTNILNLIVTGDASLESAMKRAGITKVHHIDHQVTSILGLFSTYKLLVYGE